MCCKRLAEKYRTQKLCKKIAMRTFTQGRRAMSSQLKHVPTIGKTVKQKYLIYMSPQYGKRRFTSGWDRFESLVHAAQQISTGFASWLRYCTDVTQRRSTKPCMMFGRFLGWYTIYTFVAGEELLPLVEFCHVENSLCVQVLRSPILAALLHGTRAVGVSQTLRHGTQNGITELSLLVIFDTGRHLYILKSAITVGIGPYSSCWKPNSITLAGSKLVADRFEACRRPASNLSATSFEPASVINLAFLV